MTAGDLASPVWIITAMAVVTLLPRLLGLTLAGGRRAFDPTIRRFLRFVPITVFASLIGPALVANDGTTPLRFMAAGVATLILLRTRSLALGLATGLASYWVLRFVASLLA